MTAKCARCEFETESPRGLKKHYTAAHGGWTMEEISEAFGGGEASTATGFASLEEMANKAPVDEIASEETAPKRQSKPRKPRTPAAPTAEQIELQESLARYIDALGSQAVHLFLALVRDYITETPSPERIKEASDTWKSAFKALQMSITSEPLNIVLKPWMLLILPIAAMIALVAPVWKRKDEDAK